MAWLDAELWKRVQDSVPIPCVDVVTIRRAQGLEVGLIRRDTPHQGPRWCTVGGRLLRNESFAEALARQLRETLGPAVRFDLPADPQPLYIAQYFNPRRAEVGTGNLDPRQHAVGMTFAVEVTGTVRPGGEAHEFRWFPAGGLPEPEEWGFEQDRIVRTVLQRIAR